MYDQYIAEIDRAATTFLLQIVWVCLLSLLHSEQQKKLYRIRLCITLLQGYSRSFKLVQMESVYVTSY